MRLGNRIRQQLWRYYPQLLELTNDVAAEWVLELWMMAPTPAKASRLRQTTLARLLKQHRIRRINADTALGILRAPGLKVAAGVTEAAVLHLRSLVARLRLANCEFHQAERKLDELCAALTCTEVASATPPSDAAILASLPGVGMRYAAQARLRQAVFHWARAAAQSDAKSRARYDALRARGHSYGRALRSIADRLLGIACVLLLRREMFDPDHGAPATP